MVKKSIPNISYFHPAIRIVCLIIVSIFVVSANPVYLEVTLLLLLIGFSMGTWSQFFQCVRVLMRLKWLFITIFIIYLSLTPGQNIFPIDTLNAIFIGSALNSFFASLLNGIITIEGLYYGALRIFSLVILILTVNLLIQAKQHAELSYAIIWLLSPLKYIGCSVDRLAIRISLTFRYVSEFQQTLLLGGSNKNVRRHRAEDASTKSSSILSRMKRQKLNFQGSLALAADKSVGLVNKVLARVNEADLEPILQPLEQKPRLMQWLLPLMLLGLYLSLLS